MSVKQLIPYNECKTTPIMSVKQLIHVPYNECKTTPIMSVKQLIPYNECKTTHTQ